MELDEKIQGFELQLNRIQLQCDTFELRMSNIDVSNKKSAQIVDICINYQLSQKSDKKDLVDSKEDFINYQIKIAQQFSQTLNIDKFTHLSEQLQEILSKLKTFASKEQLNRQLNELKDKNPQINDGHNAELEEAMKKIVNEFNLLKSSLAKKNENVIDHMKILEAKINLKLDISSLKLNLNTSFIQKEDVKIFQDRAEKLTQFCNLETKQNKDSIVEFQKVINRFDYDLLFLASKMDLKEIREVLRTGLIQQNSDIREGLELMTNKFSALFQIESIQIGQNNFNSLSKFLTEQANKQLKKDVQTYLSNLQLEDLKEELNEIKFELKNKVPWNLLNDYESKKQSKLSAESMAQHNIMLQKLLKHALIQLLQFISLFDSQESINMKKAEFNKSYLEISNVIQQLNQLNITNVSTNNSQIIKKRSSTRMDDISPKQNIVDCELNQIIRDSRSECKVENKKRGRELAQTTHKPTIKLRPLLGNRKYS